MYKQQIMYMKWLVNYLKDAKKEIEKDGMIATLDEAIERVEKSLNALTCLAGEEDALLNKELNK